MPILLRSWLRKKRINEHALRTLAQKILVKVKLPYAELSLELVGNTRMQTLNHRYRRRNRPTDVLAFSSWEGPGPRTTLLGDVVISLPMAETQALELGHSVDEELAQLLIHGVLHLIGYDHERSMHEAQRMHRKEQAIMKSLHPIPKITKKDANT